MIETRVPPQNIEAEQSVLGAMLQDKNAVWNACSKLKPEDFYKSNHATIFTAILSLFKKDQEVDILTVTEALQSTGNLDAVGGITYINDLPMRCISVKGVDRHIQIIKDKSRLRRLLGIAQNIEDQIFSETKPAEQIFDEAESNILDIAQESSNHQIQSVGEAMQNVLVAYADRMMKQEAYPGLSSGIEELDKTISGFKKGNLIILAGRPGMGKTSFAITVLRNLVFQQEKSCLLFSLEMSQEEMAQSLLAASTYVSNRALGNGEEIPADAYNRLAYFANQYMDKKLHICNTAQLTVANIKSICRNIKAKHGLDFIIIDYLQLLSGPAQSRRNRYEEVSSISRDLKNLAGELDVPILVLSQLNRRVEDRENKRPLLYDLRESGSIEQDADIVMFLYREKYYKNISSGLGISPHDGNLIEPAEIIVAKNRRGPTATIEVSYAPQFSLFDNATKRTEGGEK